MAALVGSNPCSSVLWVDSSDVSMGDGEGVSAQKKGRIFQENPSGKVLVFCGEGPRTEKGKG